MIKCSCSNKNLFNRFTQRTGSRKAAPAEAAG
jgi:hypothetical protein